jgi:iron complex transport system substrate-binding protein
MRLIRFLAVGAVLLVAFAVAQNVSAQTSGSIPRRIVTLSPNLTETVFALGCGDRLVGVSDFCDYPEEAKKKQRCGGWANPNYEVLAMLSPDLVIVLGRHEKVSEFCQKRSIAVMQFDMDSIATIKNVLMTLGARLGVDDNAKRLCANIDRDLEALRVHITDANRPRVYISLSRQAGSLGTMLTTGKGTFVDELVTLAGGRNVFDDVKTPYIEASKEALVARRHDVILE